MNTQTSNQSLIAGLFFVIALFVAGFIPFAALHAEGPVIRSGETVGVEANQVLEGDFYGLGQTVTLSGEAKRDVYVVGGAVTTNAPIQEDLVAIGGMVQVHGEVKDDARIIGGEVVIAEPVSDDLVVIGGKVHILSTAKISGDLIFFGGDVQIDGPVDGTVYGTSNTVRIDAHVGGDVSVRTGESFTLGDAAEVSGNITYKSTSELVRAQGAVVTGTITREALGTPEKEGRAQPLVLNALILLFTSLTVFFLMRSRMETLMAHIVEGYGRLGLIGLGMIVALPIVAIILMASVIGFAIGLALFLAYLVLIVVSLILLPIVAGVLAQRLFRLGDTITIFTVILGAFIMLLLPWVPFIGGFLIFLMLLVIIGVLCNGLYHFFKAS